MSKHSDKIEGFNGSAELLTEQMGDLYYNSLEELLDLLSNKILDDAQADLGRNRIKLAGHLISCSKFIEQAAREAEQAWGICQPYQQKYDENNE